MVYITYIRKTIIEHEWLKESKNKVFYLDDNTVGIETTGISVTLSYSVLNKSISNT